VRAALVALALASLALRPQIVGVGPLIPAIQEDLDTTHAVVGLLGTIPVLCMGLFAPLAAYLGARIGTRQAMTIGLALIGGFGLLRAVAPGPWTLVLLTVGVGLGMGLGNALAPLAVREVVPDRAATGTGVYTGGIQLGSTLSAALAVPLAGLLGGWRGALAAISLVAIALCGGWTMLTRRVPPHVRPAALVPRLPVRSPMAWLLVAIFALMASAYYGLNAWLPDAYVERGWSDRAAGGLLAAMNLTAIAASFLFPWISGRRWGRPTWLVLLSVVFTVAATGLVAAPTFAYGWALLAGVAQGGMFALTMLMPLALERRPERLGALVALMLGAGYTLGAISPFVLGAVRDATGSFDAVLWTCVGFLCGLIACVAMLRRLVAGQLRG
jgi:MFS transporter, CP family, cyanate transporter